MHKRVCVCKYKRFHTKTAVQKVVLLQTNPSSDEDSGFMLGFGDEASLPLTQSAPAVPPWYHQTFWVCCHSVRMLYLC